MASTTTPVRTDLVISMTLAELFLLLLFVVWYGFSSTINQDPLARLKDELAACNKEKSQLKGELKGAEEKIADLEDKLRIMLILLGLPKDFDPTKAGAAAAINKACKEQCRSFPTCDQQNNVLIEASVIRGQISLKVLTSGGSLSTWMAGRGHRYPAVGVSITDPPAIQRFLDDVSHYYPSSKVEGRECRFDYRLRWASDADYRKGRVLFEPYFYPAGITQVPEQ
jgi:hypothetical protein